MQLIVLFTILTLFLGCTRSPRSIDQTKSPDSIKTSQLEELKSLQEADDCVFDTSAFKFTSEALRKYDKNISFYWDEQEANAHVKLNDNDSLILHIGGCTHFSYQATFITDSSTFQDTEYLLRKTRWLAETFFSNGFDAKYVYCIEKKLYKEDKHSTESIKLYTIVDPDTTITDHVYEGWTFKKENGKTRISLLGYQN
jgi:hypothetical protein